MNAKPVPLDKCYTAELDIVDKQEWEQIISLFLDANIYQTWSYEAVRCGGSNISHIVVRSASDIIAAAQARTVQFPGISTKAAYVRWGPLWQHRERTAEPEHFRSALRALRNEYVCRQRMILRIFPLVFDSDPEILARVLFEEGFMPVSSENRGRTLIMDIGGSLDELRKNMDQKWRNCLNRAERNGLQVVEGADDSVLVDFIALYRQLLERKKFQEPNDINDFRKIQRDLPQGSKMNVFLCRSEDGAISAGAICSAVGETGIYLFGATNDQGMKNKGSYLLQWRAIKWMKENGCKYYNLNGINPLINPGTYHFKAGLSGKNGRDVFYLGRFDCYSSAKCAAMAYTGDLIIPFIRKIKSIASFSRR